MTMFYFVSKILLVSYFILLVERISCWRVFSKGIVQSRKEYGVREGTNRETFRRFSASMSAISPGTSLLRKGKRKFVDELYTEIEEQGYNHYIAKFMKTGEREPFIEKPINFYGMTKYLGVFTVMPEFNRKCKTNCIFGLPPPEIMSGVYRDAGARAIIVAMDNRTGGASTEDFRKFTMDQTKSRTFLPGPIPVVWSDFVIDKVQIHQAAALGASAITIDEGLVDNAEEILHWCKRYKLEPIYMIKNVEKFDSGIKKGIRCFVAHQLDEEPLKLLRQQLPSKSDAPELFIAAKTRPASESLLYYDIEMAWAYKDFGYDGVWPSPDGLYSQEMSEVYAGIIAMKAKASRRYITASTFLAERKKEGVTEYLGDILY